MKEEPAPNKLQIALEQRLPAIVKSLSKKVMTTLKQWQEYIKECPDGYGLHLCTALLYDKQSVDAL